MDACNSTVGAAHGAVNTKTCKTCGETKPLEDFYKDSRGGRRADCKRCYLDKNREYNRQWQAENKEYGRQYRDKNRDHYREYGREHYAENKENILEYQQQYRAENREKCAAHRAVTRAIKGGSLVRPDRCSQCGKLCTPDAHHDDYSKPLEVRWLCRACHKLHHGTEKEGRISAPLPHRTNPQYPTGIVSTE